MNEELIYSQALAKPTQETRSRFLDEACGDDRHLRDKVEALLAARERVDEMLDDLSGLSVDDRASHHDPLEDSADEDSLFDPSSSGVVFNDGSSARIIAGDDFVFEGPTDLMTGVPLLNPEAIDPRTLEFWRAILKAPDQSRLDVQIENYRIVKVLGRGGMGVVLRAEDTKLDRIVALKVLAPEFNVHPTAFKRFVREAKAVASVSHDNVVKVFAINEDSHPPMIVMEYVEGESLSRIIKAGGALDVLSITRLGEEVADGLAAAHQQGLIHRDVKPSNILLEEPSRRVKLSDFGLARGIDDVSLTKTGQVFGTPLYMSPEQANAGAIDHRSDLFSFGSVLYAMCTGQSAFMADSGVAVVHRVVHDQPTAIDEINPEIPAWLCAIVETLLEKDPEDRFESAEQVAQLLQQHRKHIEHPESSTQPAPLPRRFSSAGPDGEKRLRASCNYLGILGGLSVIWGAVGMMIFDHDLNPFFLTLYLSILTGLSGLFAAYQVMNRNSRTVASVGCLALMLPVNPLQVLGIFPTYRVMRVLRSPELRGCFRSHTWFELLKLPLAFCLAIGSLYVLGVVILKTMTPRAEFSRVRTLEDDGHTKIIIVDR